MSGEGLDRLVLCISGFRQSEKRSNAMFELFRSLMEHRRRWGIDSARVEYRTWSTGPAGVGEYAQRLLAPLGEVYLFGYSYGGHAAVRIAWELEGRGIAVPGMTLVDPVRRFPLKTASLLRWWTLKLPRNVREAEVFLNRHRGSLIKGHEVEPDVPVLTRVTTHVLEGFDHDSIPWAPAVQERLLLNGSRALGLDFKAKV